MGIYTIKQVRWRGGSAGNGLEFANINSEPIGFCFNIENALMEAEGNISISEYCSR